MLEMFQRSKELYGVKYSNFIGDGDAKTFKAILDAKSYGDDFTVVKSECDTLATLKNAWEADYVI